MTTRLTQSFNTKIYQNTEIKLTRTHMECIKSGLIYYCQAIYSYIHTAKRAMTHFHSDDFFSKPAHKAARSDEKEIFFQSTLVENWKANKNCANEVPEGNSMPLASALCNAGLETWQAVFMITVASTR